MELPHKIVTPYFILQKLEVENTNLFGTNSVQNTFHE